MLLQIKKFFENNKYMVFRSTVCILILCILMGLSISSMPVSTIYSYNEMDETQEDFFMAPGNRIEQIIQFRKPYVERLAVCINNMTHGTHGKLRFFFHEKESDVILAEGEIDLDSIEAREFIWFDVKQSVDVEKQYQLDIFTNEMEGEIKILCRNQNTTISEVTESATEYGVPLDKHMAIDIAYRAKLENHTLICLWILGIIFTVYILGWEYITATKERLQKSICASSMVLILPLFYSYCIPDCDAVHTKMYMGLVLYFLLLVLISFGLFYRKKISFLSFFIAVTLLNGVAYSFVYMPVSSPDEGTHFYESYRLSSIMMGVDSTDEYGNVLIRKCDLNDRETQITDKYVVELWEKSKEQISKDDEEMVSSDFPWVVYAPILGYVPQAIGITFARMLHLNYFWLMYFGRFVNLLTYIILVTLGLYAVPKAKWIVFAICNFPFIIQETASLSYDTLIIGFSILLCCYVFSLMEQKQNISLKQIGLLIVICMCFSNFKPIYFPLIGLVLLIPNKSFGESFIKSLLIKGFILIVSVGMLKLVYYHGSPLNVESLQPKNVMVHNSAVIEMEDELFDNWVRPDEGIVHFSGGVSDTAKAYLVQNPLDMFEKIVYTLFESIDWFVLYFFGNYMGGHEIRIPITITILFIIWFMKIINNERNGQYSKEKTKMNMYILFLISISVFGLILVSYLQWSDLSSRRLIGIQGRYFYPLSGVIIFANYGKIQEKEEDSFVCLSIINTVHILTLLYSQSIIWSR